MLHKASRSFLVANSGNNALLSGVVINSGKINVYSGDLENVTIGCGEVDVFSGTTRVCHENLRTPSKKARKINGFPAFFHLVMLNYLVVI